jgi:hypothetical protein
MVERAVNWKADQGVWAGGFLWEETVINIDKLNCFMR